jgi:hypothetical protein
MSETEHHHLRPRDAVDHLLHRDPAGEVQREARELARDAQLAGFDLGADLALGEPPAPEQREHDEAFDQQVDLGEG